RRAGAERHLVRRPDDEPVAARGRRLGFERGAGRRHRRGAGRVLRRQRNRRQYRRARHALRRGRAASDIRPRAAPPRDGPRPRAGAITLGSSLDKLGPMTRSGEDAMLVLQAITGPDAGDVSSVPSHLEFDAAAGVNGSRGLKVGYFPAWMKENPATDVDRAAL